MSFKPLLWKNYEKGEKDDFWPKKLVGAALVYLDDLNKYYVIGGGFNIYENLMKNYELNTNIIKAVDRKIDEFGKFNNEKKGYLIDLVYNNPNKQVEVLCLNLQDGGIDVYNFRKAMGKD
jgi:hypothetical protein